MKKLYALTQIILLSIISLSQTGIGCDQAINLAGNSGNVTFNTSTSQSAFNGGNFGLGNFICPFDNDGKDLVYKLNNQIPAGYTIYVWGESISADPYVTLTIDSCLGEDQSCKPLSNDLLAWYNNTGVNKDAYLIIDQENSSVGSGILHWEIKQQTNGNTCNDAIVLSGTSGMVNISNNQPNLINTFTSSFCGSSDASDVVMQLDLVPDGYSLYINHVKSSQNIDIIAYQNDCNSINNSLDICLGDNQSAIWENNSGASQQIYLILDGEESYNTGGSQIEWEIFQTQPGNTCENAISLTGSNGTINYNTDQTYYSDNYSSFCGGSNGNDVVYKTIPVPADSIFTAWINNSNHDHVLTAYLHCDSSHLDCETDNDTVVWFNNTGSSQELFIVVDGHYDNGMGDLNWSISSLIPADGNTCQNSITLTGDSGSYDYNTNNISFTNSSNFSCNEGGNDIYFLTPNIPVGHSISLSITNDNYDIVIYAGYGSCGQFTEVICHDEPDSEIQYWTNNTNSPVQLTVVVDGWVGGFLSNGNGAGSGTLNWGISEPTTSNAQGQSCDNPISLMGSQGSYTYNSSIDYSNVSTFNCNADGNDVFFEVANSISPGQSIQVWSSNDNYDVVFSAGYGSCSQFTEVICHDDPDGDVQTWTNNTSQNQTLLIITDAYNSGGGVADLNWQILDSSSTGIDCESAIPLSGVSGSYNYNTDNLTLQDLNLLCNSGGNDLYFVFSEQVPFEHYLNVRTVNDNYDVVLGVGSGSCLNLTPQLCHDDPDGETQSWFNNTGTAQQVFVVVDGYNGSNGQATLEWNISENNFPVSSTLKNKKIGFDLYPNPASDLININFHDFNSKELYIVEITDVLGKTAIKEALGSAEQSFSISALPSGFYHAIIKSENNSYSVNFSKK